MNLNITKEQELMIFLHEQIFDPVLNSKTAPKELKAGVTLTIARMNSRDAKGMVKYFWSAVIGTERSVGFSRQMKDAGFKRFEEALEEFREKFNDDWLRK